MKKMKQGMHLVVGRSAVVLIAALTIAGTALAATVNEDFESATAPAAPGGWSTVGASGSGSYATTAGTGNPGQSGNADWTGGNQTSPGVYLHTDGLPFDASQSISGSFDFYIDSTENYGAVNFILGDVQGGFSGSAGEFINAWMAKATFGTRARVYDGDGSTILFNGNGNNTYSVSAQTWHSATFSWTPTNGLTGNFSISWSVGKGPMTVSGYTFSSSNVFAGFGTGRAPGRFDNISITGTFIPESPTVPPEVVSIADSVSGGPVETYNPVTYTVTFDEAMDPATITTADFSATAGSTAGITVDSVSGSADVYDVVVTPTSAGSLVLQVSSNVTDLSGNLMTNNIADLTTITVQANAPTVTDISSDKDGVDAEVDKPITYTVTFSETMDGSTLAVGDFVNASNATITVDSVSPGADTNVYTVVVTPSSPGGVQLQLSSGSADDLSAASTAVAWTDATVINAVGDVVPPEVSSIVDDQAGGPLETGTLVTYTVTFDETVDASTVGVGDFVNASNATLTIDSVSPGTDTNIFTVGVTPTGAGGLRLQLAADSVTDVAGNTNDVAWTDDTVITVVASVPGDGTWDVDASGDWGDVANWQGLLIADGTNNTATFPNNITADRTVTLDSDRTLGNITFADTSHHFTISGGNTLTLNVTSGSPTINVADEQLTVSSVVAGNDGIAKTGSGDLYLSGVNTFTGGIDLSAGRILVRNNANEQSFLGDSGNTLAFTADATLHNVDATVTLPQNIAISNGVTANFTGGFGEHVDVNGVLSGSGTLNFQGGSAGPSYDFLNTANTFTGPIRVDGNSGNATLGFSSLPDSPAATLVKLASDSNNGGQFAYKGASAPAVWTNRQFELINNGNAGNNFSRQAEINNSASSANTVTINADLLVTGTGTKTLVLGGGNTGDNTFAGEIPDGSAALSIYKDDSGTWLLAGANTYSGKTTINNGTLSVDSIGDVAGGASALGNPSSAANGLIRMGAGNSTANLVYTGSAASSDRTIQVNSSNNGNTGGARIQNDGTGALTFTAPVFNSTYTLGSSPTRTLTLRGSNGGTIEGTIQDNSGTGKIAVSKEGAGTWTLSGTNTYTGATTINSSGGILQFARTVALYDNTPASWTKANIIVNSGGTLGLSVGGTDEFTAANVGTLLGNLTTSINNNGLRAGSILALDTANASPTTVTVTDAFVDSSGTGGGTVGLHKVGANTLELTGANTYSGATRISGGVLDAANGSGLSASSYVRLDGGVLQSDGAFTRDNDTSDSGLNFQWMSANGGGFAAAGSKLTVTVNNNASTEQVWGSAAANNAIWGTLLFGSASADAEVELKNDIDLNAATRTIDVASGAGGDSATLSGVVRTTSGTAGLIKTGAGTLALSGANTYNGGTTVSNGTLQLGSGSTAGGLNTASAITVESGAVFAVNRSDTVTQGTEFSSAAISGAGGFSQLGSGTTVLGSANTYTGPTTVEAGILQVNGSLAAGSAVAVNGGDLAGSGTISGTVTVAAAGSVAPGTSVGTLSIGGGLDVSALAAGGAGRLKFELATTGASDQAAVTGTLTIGSNQLGFSDFLFTDLAGYGPGTYVLITSGGISGTLNGSDLSGAIGSFLGTLQINGNNIELLVAASELPPIVINPSASSIDLTSATIGGNITTNGGQPVLSRGTSWSTNAAGQLDNLLVEGGTSTGLFSEVRAGMSAGENYYGWAWASNTVGIGFTATSAEFYTEPTAAASASFDVIGGSTLSLSWTTNATMGGALVLMKQGSAVDVDPTDGSTYADNTIFGSAEDLGSGNRAVFDGTGDSVTVSGLSPLQTYHVKVYAYSGSGGLINYQLDSAPVANATTTARTLTWDANAAGALQTDGAGGWTNASQWWDGLANATWDSSLPDNAVIGNGGTGGTITAGVVNAGSVIFTNFSGTYTLSEGVVTNSAGITIASDAGNVTATAEIHGAGGVSMGSSGTLVLNADNSFSGGIDISDGLLQVSTSSDPNSLGDTNNIVTFSGDATLHNANNTFTMAQGIQVNPGVTASLTGGFGEKTYVSGPVTGSGTISQRAASNGFQLRWDHTNNTFSGTFIIGPSGDNTSFSANSFADGAGVLQLGGNSKSASFTINSGSVAPIVFDNREVQLGSTTGALSINNNAPTANTITINTGVAVINTGNKTLTLGGNNTGDNTIAGAITNGAGAVIGITKSGSGKWVLSGANTYTGETKLSGGTLAIGSLKDFGVASGLGAPSSGDIFHDRYSTTSLRYTGSGDTADRTFLFQTYTLNNNANAGIYNDGSGALILDAETLNTYGSAYSRQFTLSLGGSFAAAANEIQGTIQDAAAGPDPLNLIKRDAGTWTLSGTNTYTGTTTVNSSGGILNFAKAVALYNNTPASWTKANIIVNSGGTLGLNVGGTEEFSAADVGTLLGNLTTSINNNGLRAGAILALDTANASPTTVTVTDAFVDSTGTGGGAVGLHKLGANTLELTGANTYSGPTRISEGVLAAASGSGLSANSYVRLDGGVLQSDGAFTRDNDTGDSGLNFQWMSADGGGFAAEGSKLTVTVNNNASTEQVWGNAAANNAIWGTLLFGSASADAEVEFQNDIDLNAATRTIDVASGAGGDFATLSGVLRTSSGTAGLIKTGAGTLALLGANTYNGGTTVSNGTLRLGSGSTAGALNTASAITVESGAVFAVNRSDTVTQGTEFSSAAISGAGGFSQLGSGTTVLGSANTYTGPTTVEAGILQVNGSLAAASAVAVNGGDLAGSGTVNGSVTVAAAGSVAPGTSVGTLSIGGGLDVLALAAGGAGRLKFELATTGASDQAAVTGTLTIGSGQLGFSDFLFTDLAGYGPGTYVLITSGGISGTLNGADLSGAVGGFLGTLQINGNNIELVVTSSDLPPIVINPSATSIDLTSASIGGTITTNGGQPILSRGTSWSTSAAGQSDNVLVEGSTATGTFSVVRTGMTAGGHYYGWAWASNSIGIGFTPTSAEFYTEPNAAALPSFDVVGGSSVTISWATNASMGGSLVLMKQGSAVDSAPVDGSSYADSTVFTVAEDIGGGNRAVFAGAGDSVTVSGLSPVQTYHIAVYAFSGSGGLINYQQDGAPVANATTTARTLTWDANGLGASQTDGDGTWTNANQWWDGLANASWDSASPDNAVIGNGGTGGAITAGVVNAGSITFTNFSGTYTVRDGSVTNSDGIVIASDAANVTMTAEIHGAGGITKAGSGTLILNADSSFTGGIDISGGVLQLSQSYDPNSLGDPDNIVTVSGDAEIYELANLFTMAQGIQVNAGVTVNIRGNFGEKLYVNGPVTGDGTVISRSGSNGFELRWNNTTNTFTGELRIGTTGANTTFRCSSLADSANPLQIGSGSSDVQFIYQGSAVAPLVLSNRELQLNGRATINNSASGTNTITIAQDVAVTSTGNKTLTLTGGNAGDNTIAGAITNGASAVISITKSGSGRWIFTGVNGYSGTTTVSGGTLELRGREALLDGSTLNITSGKVEIEDLERVDTLQFGGVGQAVGTYGSTSSPAANKNDTYFTGPGVLYVGIPLPKNATIYLLR